MLVRDAAGVSELVDFRETAPRSASRDMFNYNLTLATDSTRGAGVPGEIKGFAMAHTKYGILPWASLFDPSICLAKEGFEVTEKMAEMISVRANLKLVERVEIFRQNFKVGGDARHLL